MIDFMGSNRDGECRERWVFALEIGCHYRSSIEAILERFHT